MGKRNLRLKRTNMKALLLWSIKETMLGFAFAILLMLAVLLVFGPFLGIAVMVDVYGHWCFALYIPYFLLLPILAKPLGKFYGD